jgi:toxin-antitoxin system PIN domain toxin
MILPDINLLIYAHNLRSPQHEKARDWWRESLSGTAGIALPWVVIQGFVRLATHPKIFEHPMPVADALDRVGEWLALPHCHIVHPPDRHFDSWRRQLLHLGSAANLTTDAHLAALAIDRGFVLHSTDADFARFPGLKWINPLAS